VHVAFEIKSDTGNNRATETISESFRKYLSNITGITKLRNSKKKISHIEYCTRNTESDIVKVKNLFHWRNNITRDKNCEYSSAAILLS